MDINDLYPSITEETLVTAIVFAQTNTSISNDVIQTIKHSRKPSLFHNNDEWKRKSDSCFDITMRSHGGAEVCELVGSYIATSYKTQQRK